MLSALLQGTLVNAIGPRLSNPFSPTNTPLTWTPRPPVALWTRRAPLLSSPPELPRDATRKCDNHGECRRGLAVTPRAASQDPEERISVSASSGADFRSPSLDLAGRRHVFSRFSGFVHGKR
ncbi:hypothetical protein C2E23DRAFT_482956 [Lenzites betulinus]|nr:hypothetical protein C2E23DRAFT_482956 [Lenzites betulinus]